MIDIQSSLLTDPAELEQMLESLRTDFEQEHFGSQGAHGDVTLDSITARQAGTPIAITGILRFLGGAWLLDEEGNNSHVAGLRPLQWTTRQDNYTPPGMDEAKLLEVETDADRSITGLKRRRREKRLLIFGNRGNFNVTLEHNDSNSLYYNRFGLPGSVDLVLAPNEYIWLYYDVGSEIWRRIL